MAVSATVWGSAKGAEVTLISITNGSGASLVLTNFGATLVQMHMPAPDGAIADIVLGFDDLSDYKRTETYFGATVGRFGNRIREGKFSLDGIAYEVSRNEGKNSLHGGVDSYDKRVWDTTIDEMANSVTFSLISPDGDAGFPGRLTMNSTYTLTEDNVVRIDMRARTDKTTLCNMVHHSYFNLAGHDSGAVLDQELCINSDFYTPVDSELIITGEVLKVADTPFDFRTPTPIGKNIAKVPNAGAGRMADGVFAGYDHNWCLRGEPFSFRPVLTVRDPKSGRGFELFTNQPGVHFYTGGYLDEEIVSKAGTPYRQFSGFTFETQTFPDSPNLSHVPQARLEPGELYQHIMEFRFFC